MAKLTLAQFAEAKGFTVEQLAQFGVRPGQGGIVIPYYDERGNEYIKYRVRDDAADGKGFRWSRGEAEVIPYGVHKPVPYGRGFLWVVEGECFTGDAQVLSPSGWVRLDALGSKEQIAQYEQGKITFVTPERIVRKRYDGQMVSFRSKQFAQTVTPSHKMLCTNGKIYRADAVPGKISIPRTGVCDGDGLPLSNDEITLALAVSADAKIDKRVNSGPYCYFSLTKARKITRLLDTLGRLGLKHDCWPDRHKPTSSAGTPIIVRVRLPQCYAWIGRLLPWAWVSQATQAQRDFILHELAEWDGNHVPNRAQIEYATIHQHNAELVQALAHTAGYRSTIMPRKNAMGSWFKVSVLWLGHPAQVRRQHQSQAHYSGMVYCPTVPSGFFIVRQNGIVSVSGNSDCWALWGHNMPALGLPGAASARCLKVEYLESITQVCVVQEPGEAGERFPHRVATRLYDQGFNGSVYAVVLPSKDPRSLLVELGSEGFVAALKRAYKERRIIPRPQVALVTPKTLSVSLAELFTEEPAEIDWLIDGMLPVGGIGLLSAKAKTGKSVLARTLALAVARGRRFLGRATKCGTVLWVALEERREDVIAAFRDLGAQPHDPIRFHFGRAPENAIQWLRDECDAHNVALVVIDTWHKLTMIENINDYASVNRANEPLMELARQRNVGQIWLHHNNKGDSGNGDEVLGSSALFAAADCLISLRRSNDGVRTMRTIQRTGVDMDDTAITMDPVTGIVTSAGSAYLAAIDAMKPKVRKALSESGPLTRTDLGNAVKAKRAMVYSALNELLRDGIAEVASGTGTKGDPFLFGLFEKNAVPSDSRCSQESEEPDAFLKLPYISKKNSDREAEKGSETRTQGGNGWESNRTAGAAGTAKDIDENELLDYAEKRIV